MPLSPASSSSLGALRPLAALVMLALASPAVATEPDPAAQASTRRYVTGSYVRLRADASKEAEAIDLLPWGTEVELLSSDPENAFQRVRLRGSERTGAVAASYLSVTPPTPQGRVGRYCGCVPCSYTAPSCLVHMRVPPIDKLERAERSGSDWNDAFTTWLVGLGPDSPYATASSIDALNASPLFRDFAPAPPETRAERNTPEGEERTFPGFTDPPFAGFTAPPDLDVARILKTGSRWQVQLAHPPRGEVYLSKDRSTVHWKEPRKAILVDGCGPGFTEVEVRVSAEIAGGKVFVTPTQTPPQSLECLEGRDVTYGRDPSTLSLLLMDQGGLSRLREALEGTRATRDDFGGRQDAFEVRFKKDGRTNVLFRGATDLCGSVDTSVMYRVGEGWEEVAALPFGDSC